MLHCERSLPRGNRWTYRGKTHAVFQACAYGIPAPCGWGVAVLGRDTVEALFVKELATATFTHPEYRMQPSDGAFRRLDPIPFESHELLDPCFLPGWRE